MNMYEQVKNLFRPTNIVRIFAFIFSVVCDKTLAHNTTIDLGFYKHETSVFSLLFLIVAIVGPELLKKYIEKLSSKGAEIVESKIESIVEPVSKPIIDAPKKKRAPSKKKKVQNVSMDQEQT